MDLEDIVLSQDREFWKLIDARLKSTKPLVSHEELVARISKTLSALLPAVDNRGFQGICKLGEYPFMVFRGWKRAGGMPSHLAILALLPALLGPALVGVARASTADTNNDCDQAGESPDIIVSDVGWDDDTFVHRWGTIGGITAYSFAGTSCNVGTCWADWYMNDNTHPVVAQNMFKLKDGRFQQIGQSWIKHAWGADVGSLCGTCNPGDDSHMGVNCSDLYSDDRGGNGRQDRLGDKGYVNAYTGYYSYPQANLSQTGDAIYKRLQVHNYDLDPASNPGAKYFAEMQYIQYQDASNGHGENNASYRALTVTGNSQDGIYTVNMAGPTLVGQPAVMAWKATDPSVIVTSANLPNDGKLFLGTKVTYLGAGIWRYEYAIQNLNADHAPLAISIPIPSGTTVSGSSYHDVDYHSGAAQDNSVWARAVTATAVQWKANTLPLNGLSINALRWGTLYNFRIDVNAAPGTHALLLGYNEPPAPTYGLSLSIATLTPSLCDNDGICDPGETCASCAADCGGQGGGPGCCGNGSCEAGETEAACFADCGQALAAETRCGDGIDGDRDGSIDCFDTDCCADTACDGFDVDGDGLTAACDCNDASAGAWKTPGEARDLVVFQDGQGASTVSWTPPADTGGPSYGFDVIRSSDPDDFATAGTCLPVTEPGATTASDAVDPPAGGPFFYLVRAKNACPNGLGPLGSTSSGTPHTAPPCP
jgi:hypothetical protein